MVPSRDIMRCLAVHIVYLLVLQAKHVCGDCTTCIATATGQSSDSWTPTSTSTMSNLITVNESITSSNTTSISFKATTNQNQHSSSQTPNPTTGTSVHYLLTSTGTLPSSVPPTITTNTTNTTINTISSSKNSTILFQNPLHSSTTSYFLSRVLVRFLLCPVLISATVP
ncbi:integumentary mucin C.1-like [Ictalurus furcatus]|uniref:integumentary mucin C.1-like n=1 Tax=Ictalurus furcatus TaxID=66913 RepID=UPI002350B007|nr:integumentary mucin C.1-like [Ictalurus furcatus]